MEFKKIVSYLYKIQDVGRMTTFGEYYNNMIILDRLRAQDTRRTEYIFTIDQYNLTAKYYLLAANRRDIYYLLGGPEHETLERLLTRPPSRCALYDYVSRVCGLEVA